MKTNKKVGYLKRCESKGINVTDSITAMYEMSKRPAELSETTKTVLNTLGKDPTIEAIMDEHDRRATEWDGR